MVNSVSQIIGTGIILGKKKPLLSLYKIFKGKYLIILKYFHVKAITHYCVVTDHVNILGYYPMNGWGYIRGISVSSIDSTNFI